MRQASAVFEKILGPEGVVTAPEELEAATTTTFQTHRSTPFILRPKSREEVQACVRLAAESGMSLYPYSGGKNWGYGSRVPTADGAVLLDLGRMNRILDYSPSLGYLTVEPGVTQQQAYEFLQAQGGRFWLDCSGAGPSSSIAGNTVERGFGHTPYGDHFDKIANLEVVLPSGEVIETGFGRFGNIAATPTYRWGVGPVLDGLFSQSNLGVVTRMTVWLMPRPEYFQAFFFSAEGNESIAAIVEALRPLRLDGTLRSASHIANDYKVISGLMQYPWDRAGGTTPLKPELLRTIAHEMDFGEWSGSAALYGTKAQVAEARRLVKAALKPVVRRLQFLDDRTLALADRFAPLAKFVTGWDLRRTLDLIRPVFGLMKGIPTDHPLQSVYWRKRNPPPASMDPDRDRCGLLWCAPVAPISGKHVLKISNLTTDILLSRGFEPAVSVTLLTDRTLACVISITYDREVPGEDERAMVCHRYLLDTLTESGYHFYRLGVQSMHKMRHEGAYAGLLATLKKAIDPVGVLSPGRYESR